MGQFICFYDRGLTGRDEDRVPIGAGDTRQAALADGIPTGLRLVADDGVMAMHHSYFTTVEQPDLAAEEFAAITDGIHTARQNALNAITSAQVAEVSA